MRSESVRRVILSSFVARFGKAVPVLFVLTTSYAALAQNRTALGFPPANTQPLPTVPAAAPTVAAPTSSTAPALVPAPVSQHAPSPLAPPSAHGGVMSARVAVTEFKVEGDGASPALSMQLQDGFVVGVTRTAPIYVLDSVDVARYMDTFPELQKCDGSICVKRFGQLLDVSHLIRVNVKVSGNSYTMTARLLSTEEPTPAMVPVDTETRFCNVCTVDEARQRMVQLGDELKRPIESWLDMWRPPPPPPPPPKSWRRPLAAVGIALGFATAATGGALLANTSSTGSKWKAGVAGLMVGFGTSATILGCYVLVAIPSEPSKPAVNLSVGGKF
jgi:hypothetical protein